MKARTERWMPVRVIAVLVAALGSVVACSDDSSDEDVGTEDVGTIVSSQQLEAPQIDGTVWSVTYRSESVDGDVVEVTGLVARPSTSPPADGYPVFSWAHGTAGLADDCAPSVGGAGALAYLQPYLDAGYVVAATDYEGLGGPGVHPYLVSESEARSVLDAARAAGHVVDDAGEQLLVGGHSQGGHAALAAAEVAQDWAPELELVATVAIAPAADLSVVVPGMFVAPSSWGFAVMVAAAWADVYDDLETSDVLGPVGVDIAQRATEACTGEVFGAVSEADVDASGEQLVSAQPLELDAWEERLEENSIDPGELAGPVMIVQGGQDIVVPAGVTERFVAGMCAADAETVYNSYDQANHATVIDASIDDILDWLSARLDDEPVDTTCPTADGS